MKKIIPKIFVIDGAFLLLGTAGACDAGNIGLGQTVIQLVIGLALLAGGILGQEMSVCNEQKYPQKNRQR